MHAIKSSDELLKATLDGDEEKVEEIIEKVHQENISLLKYNDENSLSCVISLAYYAAKKDYVVYRELAGGKGFADIVFIPRKKVSRPAIIVELKWDRTAETAIQQIKSKKYIESLKDYRGKVVIVGISYENNAAAENNYKKHHCKIETVEM